VTKIVVNGLAAFQARLIAKGVAGEVALTTAIDGVGAAVRDEAKRVVPVVSGDLRDSIKYADGVVYTDMVYAAIVEYGGKHNAKADPYMRPAADTADDTPALLAAKAVMDSA
jgi:hypothetical protein